MATYQKSKTPEPAEAKRERQAEAAREGKAAMAEYQADIIATRERTAKLRALRLAHEAKAAQAVAAPGPAKKLAATSAKKTAPGKPVKKAAGKKAAAR